LGGERRIWDAIKLGIPVLNILKYLSILHIGTLSGLAPPKIFDAYDAKVKVLIKSAKAVIIEPSLVKYDERLLGRMSFELVHMINIFNQRSILHRKRHHRLRACIDG